MTQHRDWRPPADKVRENRARRWAGRLGYRLARSRARRLHINDRGAYMLIEEQRNYVVLGADYDADLDEVEAFLRREEEQLRKASKPRPPTPAATSA
jgi:hypothetical protein